MSCGRCHGLMIRHTEERPRWSCWRCLACGERLDPLIQRNRSFCGPEVSVFGRLAPKALAELRLRQLIAQSSG